MLLKSIVMLCVSFTVVTSVQCTVVVVVVKKNGGPPPRFLCRSTARLAASCTTTSYALLYVRILARQPPSAIAVPLQSVIVPITHT